MKTQAQRDIFTRAKKAKNWIDTRKIAVIDDDPSFRHLMEAAISPKLVTITTFESLHALPSPKLLRNFDAVLIDYYLEGFTGVQLSEYINSFFPNVPVILISGGNLNQDSEQWPDCIKAFVPKWVGPYRIIQETLSVLNDVK